MTATESADQRLASLGIELPQVPQPIANFIPFRRHGDFVYLAGQVCEWNGDVRFVGKVGEAFDLAQAQAAARVCGLNLIAALKLACGGSLDGVSCCLRLGGFVNCTPNYPNIPQVINGASDLMHELFGPRGHHARTAVGVANLPRGAAVEVDAIFALG
ncbi:RidA family protein [Bradyrhizobium amphicarpaeae]|uniref:RidA family protein n=1 Tax=Bradyrhizobium amphicarpaeae TaxID=1404768 RepID=A0A2U8PRT9_9BRAD|nr:RidA family protein [Bradyrhizobium amphicarpaeae]AWM00331.1 RidA family protein [Bradyrhizobium amphicarpaeae]